MTRLGRRSWIAIGTVAAGLAFLLIPKVIGASKSINLDAQSANGAESAVSLDVLTTFPPKIQDRVTNRSVGNSYTFRYVSAGPGGFSSSLPPGTTSGVGAQWVWQTAQTVYSFTGTSCANDICFTLTGGPGPAPTNSPAWRVPGRTLVPNNVTVSSASLTSSLVTFFSPPQTLVDLTSRVVPLASGQLGYHTTYTNHTGSPVVIDIGPSPLGCCPSKGMLNCDGECVDYQFDSENCGGCGINCADVCDNSSAFECTPAAFCNYGYCECGGYDLRRNRPSVSVLDPTVVGTSGPRGGARFGRTADRPVPVRPLGEGVDEAPVCDTEGSTETIAPGESFDVCSLSGFLPKENSSVLNVCGDNIPDGETTCEGGDPSSSGTFMQFVPDESLPYPYPGIFITPYQVTVTDQNGDGVLQPGESGTVFISVINAGTEPLLDPAATLSSPDVDLTDDGIDDPASIVISPSYSAYSPDLAAVPEGEPGGDCDGPPLALTPSVNVVAFGITIPPDHPADVARPFFLEFVSETPTLGQISINVALTVGIGSADADLRVSLADSADPVPAGSPITYEMTITNDGPLAAANVVATNTLPAGFIPDSVTGPPGWSCVFSLGQDSATCTKSSFAAFGVATVSIAGHTAECSGSRTLTDSAEVTSETLDEDDTDNTASESTEVQELGPVARILQPVADQTGTPPLSIPITVRVSTQAGTSPTARETVSLESCVLWDGALVGDRDGLLSDESMQITKYVLCQAMARCGLLILDYPRVVVRSTDVCGHDSEDDVIIRKRLTKTEACAP